MSGALPNTSDFTAINVKSNQQTQVSVSDSGKSFRRQVAGQYWSFSLSFPEMTRANFAPLQAFMIKQRGAKESFTVTFPSYMNALGNETGSVAVNGAHTAGDTTIALDGFAGDGAGRFKAGDFIKFANHNKVYMIVADAGNIASSNTLTIEPPLQTAVSGIAITYDSVPFTVYAPNDVQQFRASNSSSGEPLFRYEIDVVEAI